MRIILQCSEDELVLGGGDDALDARDTLLSAYAKAINKALPGQNIDVCGPADDYRFTILGTPRGEEGEEVKGKTFRLIDDRDESEPLGGPLTEGNAYIAAYPKPIEGHKHPLKLDVGESSVCKYNLSGTRGVYRVYRID